ncbi:cation diffusion facilitator family transporter [Burkholderia plantarii]|uniref:cation diffusion facilitator family transporter n=1 Tax=Burkholderia plantarii TaxID=41899 RepID=UPI0018DD9828|nr:cation diffusion facilitator family transporter [Burkholderia plantarii]MBI0329659.1 cation transporter [Burkholderia plantarii]
MNDAESLESAQREAGRRSTLVSAVVNVVLSLAQVATGMAAHSQALVSDGVHSLSDLVSDFVVLIAGQRSRKAPDHDHPYGHQRYETAASLILGVMLLAVGIGMLLAAIRKFADPASIAGVHAVALWVAAAALVSKELLFRYMLRIAKRVRSSMLAANAWHARSDAASSLVAIVGIVGNLLGYPILDPVAALIVGVMVMRMGGRFAWTAINDLMDRAVDDDEVERIRQTVGTTPGVAGFHGLRTRKMGDMIMVDVHLEVDASRSIVEGHDIASAVEHNLMSRHRVLDVMTHVDPVAPGGRYVDTPRRA